MKSEKNSLWKKVRKISTTVKWIKKGSGIFLKNIGLKDGYNYFIASENNSKLLLAGESKEDNGKSYFIYTRRLEDAMLFDSLQEIGLYLNRKAKQLKGKHLIFAFHIRTVYRVYQ